MTLSETEKFFMGKAPEDLDGLAGIYYHFDRHENEIDAGYIPGWNLDDILADSIDPKIEEMKEISASIEKLNGYAWLWDERKASVLIQKSLIEDHLENVTHEYCEWLALRLKFLPLTAVMQFQTFFLTGKKDHNFMLTDRSLFDIMVSGMYGYVEAIYLAGLDAGRKTHRNRTAYQGWQLPYKYQPVRPEIAFMKPSEDGSVLLPMTKPELAGLFKVLQDLRKAYLDYAPYIERKKEIEMDRFLDRISSKESDRRDSDLYSEMFHAIGTYKKKINEAGPFARNDFIKALYLSNNVA